MPVNKISDGLAIVIRTKISVIKQFHSWKVRY